MFQQMVLVALFLNTFAEANTYCLLCNEAVSPIDCDTVVRCGEHERCYVDAYTSPSGTLRYNLGCRDERMCTTSLNLQKRDASFTTRNKNTRTTLDGDNLMLSKVNHTFWSGTRDISSKRSNNLLICSACCTGNLCSSAGCGYNGYSTPRGPICFNCPEQLTPDDCRKIKQCGQDEVCLLLKTLNPVSHEVRYKTECSTEKTCQSEIQKFNEIASLVVGKRRRRKDHLERGGSCLIQCCATDMCNVNCGNNTVFNSSATPPMTSLQTSPPTQTASTQAAFCNYKSKIYNQGDVWQDGCEYNCTCENASTGFYRCQDLCPVWNNLPAGCTMVKKPGKCCLQPNCSGDNLTPGGTANTCFYGGKYYHQGYQWRDGCKYKCTCQDGKTGLYQCQTLCLQWTLPSSCRLDPPPAGKCCEVPVCPSSIHLKYPTGFVQE